MEVSEFRKRLGKLLLSLLLLKIIYYYYYYLRYGMESESGFPTVVAGSVAISGHWHT